MTGSEDYFLVVLKQNRDTFFSAPSTFASALNLATALYHFHEWLFEEFRSQLETHLGSTLASKGALCQLVQQTNSKFGYIRDVTNASKHVKIGGPGHPRPSTGMSHIANTQIVSVGWGEGGWGEGRYGGSPNVVFDDGGSQISFDHCAQELFDYWKHLLETLTGKGYV